MILKISKYLPDKDKIYFTMISVAVDKFKYKFIYDEEISIRKIINLPYYDNFEYVQMSDKKKFPQLPQKVKRIRTASSMITIPSSVTHLQFGFKFNRPINTIMTSDGQIIRIIPESVTHLQFGVEFNQLIKNNIVDGKIIRSIPESVTHLTFGSNFDQPIENIMPPNVTHLTFGWCFNQSIKNCIPPLVTHLKLGDRFDKLTENCIPPSVTHLIIGDIFRPTRDLILDEDTKFKSRFGRTKKDCIPHSVVCFSFCTYFDQHKDIHNISNIYYGHLRRTNINV